MTDRAQGQLLRALTRMLAAEPAILALGARGRPGLTLSAITSEPWAALLYDGQLHRVELTLSGSAEAVTAASLAIAEALPHRDFEMRGQFVYVDRPRRTVVVKTSAWPYADPWWDRQCRDLCYLGLPAIAAAAAEG